jgi:hypothetical protein
MSRLFFRFLSAKYVNSIVTTIGSDCHYSLQNAVIRRLNLHWRMLIQGNQKFDVGYGGGGICTRNPAREVVLKTTAFAVSPRRHDCKKAAHVAIRMRVVAGSEPR